MYDDVMYSSSYLRVQSSELGFKTVKSNDNYFAPIQTVLAPYTVNVSIFAVGRPVLQTTGIVEKLDSLDGWSVAARHDLSALSADS